MASSSTAQAPASNEAPPSSTLDGAASKPDAKDEGSETGPRRNWIARLWSAIAGGKKTQQQQPFGGLRDVVSYSSRRMAASRALEYEILTKCKEPGVAPLFVDPLASHLAGPAAIEDAKKWEAASSVAADAVADALAAGRRRPTKEELVEVIIKESQRQKKKKKNDDDGNSAFTIGAPLSLVALAGRSIHRGRTDVSTPGSFAVGKQRDPKNSKSEVIASSKHAVSLVTSRHRWFDESMLDALRGQGYGVEVKLVGFSSSAGADADAASAAAVKVEISPRKFPGGDKIGQVVMLGSGMDARAWRLPESSGVAWFDLDSEPVIEIKKKELEEAGAETTTTETATTSAANDNNKKKNKKNKKIRFPLKCSTYAAVGCDMKNSPEWAHKLIDAGFDKTKPALFCAEGLLYYLGDGATAFLKCLSSIAAPGSVLLLDALDEAGVASAVKKADGKGLQGQFKFGVPAKLSDLQSFFGGFGFERLVAADTLDVVRGRFRKYAPLRTFSRGEKVAFGAAEGGIRFIAVAKGV